eukprot:GHVP01021560.1.p1 GENE.GHVP01021560.1~~GHVP01021560.1.p1  ORF type:complete len:425 (+),score=82.44 GHVP01021560.1:222-1496(+)
MESATQNPLNLRSKRRSSLPAESKIVKRRLSSIDVSTADVVSEETTGFRKRGFELWERKTTSDFSKEEINTFDLKRNAYGFRVYPTPISSESSMESVDERGWSRTCTEVEFKYRPIPVIPLHCLGRCGTVLRASVLANMPAFLTSFDWRFVTLDVPFLLASTDGENQETFELRLEKDTNEKIVSIFPFVRVPLLQLPWKFNDRERNIFENTHIRLPPFLLLWEYEIRPAPYGSALDKRLCDLKEKFPTWPPWGKWVAIHAQFFPVNVVSDHYMKSLKDNKRIQDYFIGILDQIRTVRSEIEAKKYSWALAAFLEVTMKSLGFPNFQCSAVKFGEWKDFPTPTMAVSPRPPGCPGTTPQRALIPYRLDRSEIFRLPPLVEPLPEIRSGRAGRKGKYEVEDSALKAVVDFTQFSPTVLHVDPRANW